MLALGLLAPQTADAGRNHRATASAFASRIVLLIGENRYADSWVDLHAVGKGVTRFQPGDEVFGIGRVQLAKALEAEVTAVCSTAKVDLVSSIGADHVIATGMKTSRRGRTTSTSSSTSAGTRPCHA